MFTWLKSLFTSMDRQTAAADRAAKALEDIAGDLESVRDQFRARLGIESPKPVVVLAAKEEGPDEEEADEKKPGGKKRKAG